jgi:hypothetical protein
MIFALLCAWSGLASLRSIAKASAGLIGNELPATEPDSPSDAAPRRSRRIEQFFWLALPASASVALLAISRPFDLATRRLDVSRRRAHRQSCFVDGDLHDLPR